MISELLLVRLGMYDAELRAAPRFRSSALSTSTCISTLLLGFLHPGGRCEERGVCFVPKKISCACFRHLHFS